MLYFPIQIQLDPSGLYAATSCSDKSVNIYDFEAGECSAIMYGHSGLFLFCFLAFSWFVRLIRARIENIYYLDYLNANQSDPVNICEYKQ